MGPANGAGAQARHHPPQRRAQGNRTEEIAAASGYAHQKRRNLEPILDREECLMATRLSVNINDATAEALRELAGSEDTSVTEIVRRAVSVYKYFHDETGAGKNIQLVDQEDDKKVVAVQLV